MPGVNGEIVCFSNGVFDLLHWGHVSFLQACKRNCDTLIVGLNSDYSVQVLKGKSRPIIPQFERAKMLEALECVDGIVVFDESDACEVMREVNPDIYAKSTEWAQNGMIAPEFKVANEIGAKILLIENGAYEKDVHTTSIIRRIMEREILK